MSMTNNARRPVSPSSSADRTAEPEGVLGVPIHDRRRQSHPDPHQHTAMFLDQQTDLMFFPMRLESFVSGLPLSASRKEPARASSPAGLGLASPLRTVQNGGGQLRQQSIQPLVNYPFRVFHRTNTTDSQVKAL